MKDMISIEVETDFVEDQSSPEEDRFVFAYTVTIENQGDLSTKLLSRHWIIENAHGEKEEVHGEGVIGEQPIIPPGSTYTYTSGAILETDCGTMGGSYQMVDENGKPFDAPIPKFLLCIPRTLH